MPVTGNGVYIYIYILIYIYTYIYIYVISSITWWRLGDGLLLNEQPRFKHITHILGNLHNKIPWKLRLYPLNPFQIYTGRYLQFQAPDTYSSWMVANLKWPLHDTKLHFFAKPMWIEMYNQSLSQWISAMASAPEIPSPWFLQVQWPVPSARRSGEGSSIQWKMCRFDIAWYSLMIDLLGWSMGDGLYMIIY